MPYKSYKYKKYKKMSRRGKRTLGRQTYRAMKAIAKKVSLKNMETKHATLASEGAALYHNGQISATNSQPTTNAQMFNVWKLIVPGTAVNNRIGTEIWPRGMSVRLYLENMGDRPNIHYRVMIGAAPKQRSDGTSTNYNNLELLDMGGTVGNLCRHATTDLGYKFFYDRVFRSELGQTNTGSLQGVTSGVERRCHLFKKIWIKRKKAGKIIYNNSASGVVAEIVNKPLFFCVLAYDSTNTLITDQIGLFSYQTKLYWKDA
jgi:hypothetical protein